MDLSALATGLPPWQWACSPWQWACLPWVDGANHIVKLHIGEVLVHPHCLEHRLVKLLPVLSVDVTLETGVQRMGRCEAKLR